MTVPQMLKILLVAVPVFAPIQAQELRYGVQIHVSSPMGDLKTAVDSKPGLGGGVHMTVDLGQGHVLRPRLDYLAFPDATVYSAKNRVNELSLGVEYLYMLEGRTGFYVLGGLSGNKWKFDEESTVSGTFSTSTTKLGYALGAGFAFNETLNLEVRFTTTQLDSRSVSNQNANAFELGALYRF